MLLFIMLLLFPSYSHALCNQTDHHSLMSFASTVSSSPPLNWTCSFDCCTWEGIQCDTNGRVTHLWLPSRGLSGRLPLGAFASLHRLLILDLSHNHLTGELPFPFSSTHVQYVDLSINGFIGPIPSSFLNSASNLSVFNVSHNSLSGPIPFVCAYSKVKLLDFSYNLFTGNIPTDLRHCSQLQVFRAGFNHLSGTLHGDLFLGATEFSVPGNSISGVITENILHLTNLSRLELYANMLTGSIPRDIGNLSQLEHLLLHGNNFTATLPPSLMNCTALKTLNLRANFLTGDLSTLNFGTLLQLTILDLSSNDFSRALPTSLYSCKSLTSVMLGSNRLEGQVTSDILGLESLSFLSLDNNRLTNISNAINILMNCKSLSTIIISRNFYGEELGDDRSITITDGVKKIELLGLGGCRLTGHLPLWLSKLYNLRVLDLSENSITGSVPDWLGSLPKLFYLDLSDNLISGFFPKAVLSLKALRSEEGNHTMEWFQLPIGGNLLTGLPLPPALYFRGNNLKGTIPAEMGELKNLLVLDLSNNNLYGAIPDELSNLANLEMLDLSENNLTGQIPTSLNGLHFLSWFSVAYNNLQGAIPRGGQMDIFHADSFRGNPLLCGSFSVNSCNSVPKNDDDNEEEQVEETGGSIYEYLQAGIIAGTCFGVVNGVVTGLLAWRWVKFYLVRVLCLRIFK